MRKIEITLFELAQRYVGVGELKGGKDHPLIQWWLSLCGFGMESPDETPWCSAFANGMAAIHTPDEHIAVADLEGMVEVTLALVELAHDGA